MNPIRTLTITFLLIAVAALAQSPQATRPERPTPPTRDPHTAWVCCGQGVAGRLIASGE